MARCIAVFLLLSFVSIVFCGFVVNQPLVQHAAHSDQGDVEHHFSMWADFSTALVSDAAAYVTALAFVVASIFLLAKTPFLPLSAQAVVRSYVPIPIRERERTRISPAVQRWLSRFELSPSCA